MEIVLRWKSRSAIAPSHSYNKKDSDRYCQQIHPVIQMPAKDIYHDAVRFALIKDDWEILTDNYRLEFGGDRLYVDIAAEKSITAQKQNRKILVEVKSFLGRSFINDLENAVGQYIIYRDILTETNSEFNLYLAITKGIYQSNFQRKLARTIITRNQVNLLIFDAQNEEIDRWIE